MASAIETFHHWRKTRPGLTYSTILHLSLLLAVTLHLSLFEEEPTTVTVRPITVELVQVADKVNIKSEPSPLPPTTVETPKPKTPPPPKQKPKAPAKPKPPQLDVKPLTKPSVPKPAPKKPEPKPKEKPKEKPAPVQEQSLMKSVEKVEPKPAPPPAQADYNPDLPLTMDEMNLISQHFSRCWTVPIGARDAQLMAVKVNIHLSMSGEVVEAEITDTWRYNNGDPFFRAAADNALRAVNSCGPIKGLRKEIYNQWKSLTINFDPKELIY